MVDLKELASEIETMTRRKGIYKVLKTEMTKLGHWKLLKRGKPREMIGR